MNGLTPKQEKFVQGLIEGKSQRQSYIDAGYSVENKTGDYIDCQASKLMKNTKVLQRYEEILQEHKNKALWTREEAVKDLIWIKDKAKTDITNNGVRQANSNAFINAIKELNTLEDIYPKEKKDENTTENKVADKLEELINEFRQ